VRELIHIPVIHSQADLGNLADSIRKISISKLGLRNWRHSVKAIEQFWRAIRREIELWDLPYEQVRLYQDGLPVCNREMEIVRDIACAGSPNHQLLLYLMEKGATLMGTESPELLLEEYTLIRRLVGTAGRAEATRIEHQQKAISEDSLLRRDRFIARRIGETLRAGEIGILFLGMLHSVEPWLDTDVELSFPICRPAGDRARVGGKKPGAT